MLSKLILHNFRCYEQHEIPFRELTIVVGKNNAGKSTLVEALRLVSLVSNRIRTSNFKDAPDWTNLPRANRGITPSLDRLEFSTKNLVYQFGEPPARISSEFVNGEKIEILLTEKGDIFAWATDKNSRIVGTKGQAAQLESASISILPQISPLQEEEKALEEAYVKANVYSSLASRHFRNQLSYLHSYYGEFIEVAEKSWPGLRIVELMKAKKSFNSVDPLLIVQEGGFVTEIGLMGHGLQMWLQTMWFIARTPASHPIVLDEPDVYMHADLQRKLIRYLRGRYAQVIIATHSIEIMSEVEPDNILIIDRMRSQSEFASDSPQIQKVIYNDIGSIHNLELAQLYYSRKFLMVEGDDIALLKRLQNKMYPHSDSPIDRIPNSDIGGWGGWQYAIGSRFVLKNAGNESMRIYCLLDSDYHLPMDKKSRLEEAARFGIDLHIWRKKEIENYLIVPSTISRLICKKRPHLDISEVETVVVSTIDTLCEELKDELIDDFASEIGKHFRRQNQIIDFTDNDKVLSYETKNINRVARRYVNVLWAKKLDLVPGKKLLKELNKRLNETYIVSIGIMQLCQEIYLEEIDDEIKYVLGGIENVRQLRYTNSK